MLFHCCFIHSVAELLFWFCWDLIQLGFACRERFQSACLARFYQVVQDAP